MSGKHAYDMLVQDLAVQVEQVEQATTDWGNNSKSMANRSHDVTSLMQNMCLTGDFMAAACAVLQNTTM